VSLVAELGIFVAELGIFVAELGIFVAELGKTVAELGLNFSTKNDRKHSNRRHFEKNEVQNKKFP